MDDSVGKDSEKLQVIMRRMTLVFSRHINEMLKRGKINLPQYSGLVLLGEHGEMTMGDLARRLGVTMGAATNVVDKLVRAGHVSRQRSSDDRRVVRVKLSAQGTALLDGFAKSTAANLSQFLNGMTPERRARVLAVCAEVLALVADPHHPPHGPA